MSKEYKPFLRTKPTLRNMRIQVDITLPDGSYYPTELIGMWESAAHARHTLEHGGIRYVRYSEDLAD